MLEALCGPDVVGRDRRAGSGRERCGTRWRNPRSSGRGFPRSARWTWNESRGRLRGHPPGRDTCRAGAARGDASGRLARVGSRSQGPRRPAHRVAPVNAASSVRLTGDALSPARRGPCRSRALADISSSSSEVGDPRATGCVAIVDSRRVHHPAGNLARRGARATPSLFEGGGFRVSRSATGAGGVLPGGCAGWGAAMRAGQMGRGARSLSPAVAPVRRGPSPVRPADSRSSRPYSTTLAVLAGEVAAATTSADAARHPRLPDTVSRTTARSSPSPPAAKIRGRPGPQGAGRRPSPHQVHGAMGVHPRVQPSASHPAAVGPGATNSTPRRRTLWAIELGRHVAQRGGDALWATVTAA